MYTNLLSAIEADLNEIALKNVYREFKNDKEFQDAAVKADKLREMAMEYAALANRYRALCAPNARY